MISHVNNLNETTHGIVIALFYERAQTQIFIGKNIAVKKLLTFGWNHVFLA
jgi:hypothetical protein